MLPETQRPLAPNHRLVFDALKSAGRPVTAYELIDRVRDAGIKAPPTVYRALNRLIEEGLAHRLESLNAFVACCHNAGHAGTVVFAICDACGAADEFTDETVSRGLSAQAEARGFAIARAVVELSGNCRDCQSKAARS